MCSRILEHVTDNISTALLVLLEHTVLAGRLNACSLSRSLPHFDIPVKLSSGPLHELPIILHPLYIRYAHKQVLDPRRSSKWAESPMGYMVQCKNWMWFAPREVVEING